MSDDPEAGRDEADCLRELDGWLAQLWLSQACKKIPIGEAINRVRSRLRSEGGEGRYQLALNLKWLLTEARRFDEALRLIDRVIKAIPDDVRFAISKANLYFARLDDPEKALEAIDLAVERAFHTGECRREALGVKARILLKLGRGEELGQVLEQIMSLKVDRHLPDIPRERDFLDAAPPGLVRADIVARYDAFSSTSPARLSTNPPRWDWDDPESWSDIDPDALGHHVVAPGGDPITADELDQIIFSVFRKGASRKTVYVISKVMDECEARKRATSDTLIFNPVLHLVASGVLESGGQLWRWRFSEVWPAGR